MKNIKVKTSTKATEECIFLKKWKSSRFLLVAPKKASDITVTYC